LRNSSFNRVALFVTAAAVQFCATGGTAAARQADAGDAIRALLLGARGPPLGSASAARLGSPTRLASPGDAVAKYLVTGQQFHATSRAPFERAPVLLASNERASPPGPAVSRPASPAATSDRIGDLLTGGGQPRPAAPAGAPPPPPVAVTSAVSTSRFPAPDPQTLLLLAVQLDDLNLADGMAAYGLPDDPQLPVGELTRLLELDVDVSPSDGRITGRIGEARRALTVDVATNTARVGPVQVQLQPGDVVVEPGEIYVRASVLAQLLPLKFAVDARNLQMKLTATEILPLQGRLARLARLRQGATKPATPVLRVDEPYQFFTPPSVDVGIGLGGQSIAPRTQTQYDVRLGGDLLYSGLQAYFGSDDTGRLTTGRVLLEKRSVDGDLLGPLHARVVGLGDVFTPGLAIGPRSLGGRGVQLSTAPLDQTNVFNRIDLRGELPIGNDVELYVNDVLQGSQNQAVNGQYEFLAVPLTQGVNVVRIVTYGPHGERSEETRIINAGGGLLHKGQATLDFAAVDQNEPLLHIGETPDPFLIDHITGKPRVIANLNYGLTQYVTLSAGGALYTDQLGVERQLASGGLRTSIAGFATEFDLAADNLGGEGASVGLAGRLFGTNAVLRHSEYRGGLLDENNPEADLQRPLARRTELDLDRNIQFGGQPIPLSVRALRDLYADGGEAWITQVRGSASLGSFLYSTGFEYDHDLLATGQVSDFLRGFVGVSTFRNYKWQVRANLDYVALPDFRLSGLQILADRSINNTWALRLGVTGQLDNPRDVGFLAGTTTKTKFGDLALTGQYDTHQNTWRLGAQMNFGLGYNPEKGYQITRSGPGSGGSVSFHAFIDANGDGVFDPGEKPVANVSLEGGSLRAKTDADGRAYLSGFGAGPTARLLVGISEIENQQVKTPPTVIEFSPRPGGVTRIEYPMRPTGEVMVSIKLRRPDKTLVGLSATRVRLVDAKGLAIEGVTEFDGSVNFLDVPAGSYRLELDKEQAARLRMRLLAPLTVVIKPDGSIAPDASAEVEFEPRGDAAPPPPPPTEG
jgi:hypothetical protein